MSRLAEFWDDLVEGFFIVLTIMLVMLMVLMMYGAAVKLLSLLAGSPK